MNFPQRIPRNENPRFLLDKKSSFQSKPPARYSLKEIPLHRSFGRDISNLRVNEARTKREDAEIKDQGSRVQIPSDVQEKLNKFYAEARTRLRETLLSPDRKNIDKLNHCAEYVQDITTYLKHRQSVTKTKEGFLEGQPEIDKRMRAVLMDWMSSVSDKFNLRPETLFMAASLTDRFLGQTKVSKTQLQGVGAAAMVIASKYEEIYPPEVKDFVRVTDKAVLKKEVLKTEGQILKTLNWELSGPSTLRFLERFSEILAVPEQVFHMALYLCELQLLDSELMGKKPSLLAASSLYLAHHYVRKTFPTWTPLIVEQSGHNESEVRSCAKQVAGLFAFQEKMSFAGASKKFSQCKFSEVSRLKLETPLFS